MAVKQEPKAEPIELTIPPPGPAKSKSITNTPNKLKPESTKEGKDAIKSLVDYKRATAWSIHRWPLERRPLPSYISKTKVHFPRSYLAKGGEDTKVIYEGMDLNQFVHRWYMESIPVKTRGTAAGEDGEFGVGGDSNFVAGDNIGAKRHEFLGPDPRVAGYYFDFDEGIHIKWWDDFLKDQWMDSQKWTYEFTKDDNGNFIEKNST